MTLVPYYLLPALEAVTLGCLMFILTTAAYRKYFHPLAAFPGPFWAGLTPLYSYFVFISGHEHEIQLELHRKYGPVVRWQPNLVVVSDGRFAPLIYYSQAEKTPHYNLTSGLGPEASLDIKFHRAHALRRRILNGAFTIKALEEIEPHISAKLDHWLLKLEELCSKGLAFDISKWAQRVTYDIGSEVFVGDAAQIHGTGSASDSLLDMLEEVLHLQFAFCRLPKLKSILSRPPFSWFFVPTAKTKSTPGPILHERDRLLRTRLEIQNKPRAHRDTVDHFLDPRKSEPTKDMELVIGEVTTYMLAHSDTIPRIVRDILLAILSNRRVHEKLATEIDDVCSNNRHGISTPVARYRETAKLPYFDACIQEAFRLHTNVRSYLPRYTPKGGLLVENTFIPEGVEVASCPWVVHRDESFFGADANEYRPERWLEDIDTLRKLRKYSLHFGGGTRMCLGRNLATLEVYKYVFEIFRRFDVELVEVGPFKGQHEGLTVKLHAKVLR